MNKITYVNEKDEVIGYGSREEAIEKGIIHRIVRLFVFNTKGEVLIQKRSPTVYVPNRWDQSASGHVDEGEDYVTAGIRELQEEMGAKAEKIEFVTKFYSEESDDNEVKKRFNSLYVLRNYDGEVDIDNDEVSEYKWISIDELSGWMESSPEDFTEGFIQSFYEFNKVKEKNG